MGIHVRQTRPATPPIPVREVEEDLRRQED